MQQLASGDAPSHPPRGTEAGVAGKTAPLCVRVFDVQPGSCQDYLYDRSSHANPLEPNTGLLSHSCLISTLAYLKSQEQFARICLWCLNICLGIAQKNRARLINSPSKTCSHLKSLHTHLQNRKTALFSQKETAKHLQQNPFPLFFTAMPQENHFS